MSDAKHTPLQSPLTMKKASTGSYNIFDKNGDLIAIAEREEIAAFIVQACNSYDALMAALKAIADMTTVQMLCPTAPSQDAADGFKLGAIQATDECARIAEQALTDANK